MKRQKKQPKPVMRPHEAIVNGKTYAKNPNLKEIKDRYLVFSNAGIAYHLNGDLDVYIEEVNRYYEFCWNRTQKEKDFRVTYSSTVFEEAIHVILGRIVDSKFSGLKYGKAECLYDMLEDFTPEKKQMDFAIYFEAKIGRKSYKIPVLGAEVKRYIDKTMFTSIWPIRSASREFGSGMLEYIAVGELNALAKNDSEKLISWRMGGNAVFVRDQFRQETRPSSGEVVGKPIQHRQIEKLIDLVENHLDVAWKFDTLHLAKIGTKERTTTIQLPTTFHKLLAPSHVIQEPQIDNKIARISL